MPTLSSSRVHDPFPKRGDYTGARLVECLRHSSPTGLEARDEILGMDIGQFFQQQIKISQLEDELSQSRQTRRYATPTLTLRNHNAILELTAELFPKAKITVSEESDPEIEDDEYFVITVETPGSVGELVKCHREWHCRIVKVAQETAIAYRLSLDIND